MRTAFSHYCAVGLALALAGCSGRSQPSLLPSGVTANAVPAAGASATLVIRIKVPKPKVSHSGLRPAYVSRATKAMTIDFKGPTHTSETFDLDVAARPLPAGCARAAGGFLCTESIGLQACPSKADCYHGEIATYDAIKCVGQLCYVPPSANELSANQEIAFSVAAGKNGLAFTLDGIPTAVEIQKAADSPLTPNGSNFEVSKCETGRHPALNVYGLDADGNTIVGSGAPTVALASNDSSNLAIGRTAPKAPNAFHFVFPPVLKSATIPAANTSVTITATVTPLGDSGAKTAITKKLSVTFNGEICGVFTEYPVPTASSDPIGISASADGTVWFTEFLGGNVGKVTGGHISEQPGLHSEPGQEPVGIVAAPAHQEYYAESGSSANGINYFETSGSTITAEQFLTDPTPSSAPYGVASPKYGGTTVHVYFTESAGNKIGMVGVAGIGESAQIPGSNNEPLEITFGPDGALWFTNYGSNSIGRVVPGFSPGGGTFTITPIPTLYSAPYGITPGPDGDLWFTENLGNKIGYITTSGKITDMPIPTSNSEPYGIIAGADGALWFTEGNGNKIGRITTTGTITELPLKHANSVPWGITNATDGSLWFTESAANNIVHLQ
jgi:streptogramin lyase